MAYIHTSSIILISYCMYIHDGAIFMYNGVGEAGVCPFHDDPVEATAQALQERILAQPLAIASLSAALSAWHYRQVCHISYMPSLQYYRTPRISVASSIMTRVNVSATFLR